MRIPILAAGVLVMIGIAPAVDKQSSDRDECLRRSFGPTAIADVAAGALIQQAENSPYEWGGGMAGFGRRLASGFGKHLVKTSIQAAVAHIRHEELGYTRSGKQGFKPRLWYALLSTVVTRKTTTGKRTFASGEIAGAVGSGFISRLWQPLRLRTVSSGIGSAGIALGVDAAANVVREFWPEIRHPHHHNQSAQAVSAEAHAASIPAVNVP